MGLLDFRHCTYRHASCCLLAISLYVVMVTTITVGSRFSFDRHDRHVVKQRERLYRAYHVYRRSMIEPPRVLRPQCLTAYFILNLRIAILASPSRSRRTEKTADLPVIDETRELFTQKCRQVPGSQTLLPFNGKFFPRHRITEKGVFGCSSVSKCNAIDQRIGIRLTCDLFSLVTGIWLIR